MFIRLHPRSKRDLVRPGRSRQEEGILADQRQAILATVSGIGGRPGVEEPVPFRSPASAEAAAIFSLSASCGARQAAGSSPKNSRGDCFRASPAGWVVAWRAEGNGPRPPPTSRVMLDREVRGTEATRTLRG